MVEEIVRAAGFRTKRRYVATSRGRRRGGAGRGVGGPPCGERDGRGRGRGRFADVIFLRALLAISLRTAYGDKLDTGALRDHAHVRTEAMAPKSPGKYEYYTVPCSW